MCAVFFFFGLVGIEEKTRYTDGGWIKKKVQCGGWKGRKRGTWRKRGLREKDARSNSVELARSNIWATDTMSWYLKCIRSGSHCQKKKKLLNFCDVNCTVVKRTHRRHCISRSHCLHFPSVHHAILWRYQQTTKCEKKKTWMVEVVFIIPHMPKYCSLRVFYFSVLSKYVHTYIYIYIYVCVLFLVVFICFCWFL